MVSAYVASTACSVQHAFFQRYDLQHRNCTSRSSSTGSSAMQLQSRPASAAQSLVSLLCWAVSAWTQQPLCTNRNVQAAEVADPLGFGWVQVLPTMYGGEAELIPIEQAVQARLALEGMQRERIASNADAAASTGEAAEGRMTRAGRYAYSQSGAIPAALMLINPSAGCPNTSISRTSIARRPKAA